MASVLSMAAPAPSFASTSRQTASWQKTMKNQKKQKMKKAISR
jgi:hypothetical protein